MGASVVFRDIPKGWGAFALNGCICVIKQREGDLIDTVIHTKSFTALNEQDIDIWVNEVSAEISQYSSIVLEGESKKIGGYTFNVLSSMCYHLRLGKLLKQVITPLLKAKILLNS